MKVLSFDLDFLDEAVDFVLLEGAMSIISGSFDRGISPV